MNDLYPLKNERLQQLLDSGINVADFICFPPNQLNESELKGFLEKHGRISCRHFHADERKHFKCPVLYEQTEWEKIIAFCREHNRTYYTLCNEAIALQESIYAGNIIFHADDRSYTVEYFKGYGTPRDIEHKTQKELELFERIFGQPIPQDAPGALKELAARLGSFRKITEVRPLIMEFSIYPYAIGKRQANYVCWEWRRGWLHYPLERIAILEAQLQESKAENEQLRQCINQLINENLGTKEYSENEIPF